MLGAADFFFGRIGREGVGGHGSASIKWQRCAVECSSYICQAISPANPAPPPLPSSDHASLPFILGPLTADKSLGNIFHSRTSCKSALTCVASSSFRFLFLSASSSFSTDAASSSSCCFFYFSTLEIAFSFKWRTEKL